MRSLTLTTALFTALAGGLAAAPAAMAKHGADDPAGHVRHGRGSDDATKLSKHRQRHGGEARRARRGADDAPGHGRRGRGADDGAGHVRHGGDDPAGHR